MAIWMFTWYNLIRYGMIKRCSQVFSPCSCQVSNVISLLLFYPITLHPPRYLDAKRRKRCLHFFPLIHTFHIYPLVAHHHSGHLKKRLYFCSFYFCPFGSHHHSDTLHLSVGGNNLLCVCASVSGASYCLSSAVYLCLCWSELSTLQWLWPVPGLPGAWWLRLEASSPILVSTTMKPGETIITMKAHAYHNTKCDYSTNTKLCRLTAD